MTGWSRLKSGHCKIYAKNQRRGTRIRRDEYRRLFEEGVRYEDMMPIRYRRLIQVVQIVQRAEWIADCRKSKTRGGEGKNALKRNDLTDARRTSTKA